MDSGNAPPPRKAKLKHQNSPEGTTPSIQPGHSSCPPRCPPAPLLPDEELGGCSRGEMLTPSQAGRAPCIPGLETARAGAPSSPGDAGAPGGRPPARLTYGGLAGLAESVVGEALHQAGLAHAAGADDDDLQLEVGRPGGLLVEYCS